MSSPLQADSLEASLTVKDLEGSLAWYRDILGFGVAKTYALTISSVRPK